MKLYLVGVEIGIKNRPDLKIPDQRVRVHIMAHSEEEARWRGEAHGAASIGKNVPWPQAYTYVAFHVSEILDENEGPHILWEDDDAKVC
jgi:hypothetical protein